MVDDDAAHAALTRAREGGVAAFMVPATKLDDAEPAVRIASQHHDVWAAVGFHPHEAIDFDDAALEQTRRLAAEERVRAIGEIGLDYYYDHSPRDVQRDVFRRQLELAGEVDLPAIIHNRDSTADLVEILSSESMRGVRGVLHSYTEDLATAEKLIDLGYFISFSGIVTFRSAESLREVARALPLERILIETDSPYLAPVPHRGKQNEPAFVVRIAELIASLKEIPVGEVAAATFRNFELLFGVKIRP
jgi:TatD DNase family protein